MGTACWKCPNCGAIETWFDRSITINDDGTEEGMTTRCVGCGRNVDEPIKPKQMEFKFMEDREVCNTTVKVKSVNFQKFADLISNQFKHGGDKYTLQGFKDREATDLISACFGGDSQLDWVLGTMMKYLFRFKNFKREKDLLKIATYCFILWLKIGGHLRKENDEDVKR